MGQTSLERSLAEAEAAIVRSSILVRQQREQVTHLKKGGENAAAARAQAMLDMLEDTLRRKMGERGLLRRGG